MSTKFSALLIFFIIILTLFSACDSEQTTIPVAATITTIPTATPTVNPTSTPAIPQGWESRWLKGIPCKPPCWEGITPGKTTVIEAVEIIKNLPFISSYELDSYGITWNWTQSKLPGIAYINSKGVVSHITPFPTLNYKLGAIISVYGEPTHIRLNIINYGNIVGYNLLLFWLKDGFALMNPINGTRPTLNNSTELERFGVITPDIEGVNNYFAGAKYDLRPWEGFKDFNYYCVAVGFYANPDCSKIPKTTP